MTLAINSYSNSQEIVKSILAQERKEHDKKIEQLKSERSFFLKHFEKPESVWKEKEITYLKLEQWVRENHDQCPTWQVAGPLHYGMSLEQMKEAITQKFHEMAKSGRIITEESLKTYYDRNKFYPSSGKKECKLTRIWGSEFLQANLNKTSLASPTHYLVVDKDVTEIEVGVYFEAYPYLSMIKNGYVIAQKIDGESNARAFIDSPELLALNYRDFTDPGNIIRDSEGINWVVDTEHKSFHRPEMHWSAAMIQEYLTKRFKILAGKEYTGDQHTFKIALSDLQLN